MYFQIKQPLNASTTF